MDLPRELDNLKEEVRAHAEQCGLDFFDVVFEILDFEGINRVAAYGGFPTRYPHWRFGMDYERLAKSYAYGLSKIYEMVINNDPCFAYLMLSNPLVDQKMVMAHVYAHSDFFKNNAYFAHTDRKAIDTLANHGARLRGHVDRQGQDVVERFLDACLSLENLIDPHAPALRRLPETSRKNAAWEESADDDETEESETKRLSAGKPYMHEFLNPHEYKTRKRREKREEKEQRRRRFPAESRRDVLLFLLENAPLERWQRDVLNLVRTEAYYFSPQGMTKIMNEGWATYWHAKMMTESLATDYEIVDFADHHAGAVAVAPGRLNPYKIGLELFRDIEERWNTGRHGPAWAECADYEKRRMWHKNENRGTEKIFEVRRMHNDVTFIDTFLTEEFCQRQKMFAYGWNPRSKRREITSREFVEIKQQLLRRITNMGGPIIEVLDANHANRGELYLIHRWDEADLQMNHAQETLKNLHGLWSRPVHLETLFEEKPVLLSFDGDKHRQERIGGSEG
jgi:stage V sporulation protein R